MTPSLDAIGEVRVETLTLPTYLGRTTGGISNFKTRGGTNTYHGTVYDFFRNTIFDANNWFAKGQAILNGTTQDNPSYRRGVDMHNEYGTTLGGPVIIPHFYNGKDRTFFFFGFEQTPTLYSRVVLSTVPTLAQRGLSNGSNGAIGDFSATLGAAIPNVTNPCAANAPVLVGQIFDPTTTQTVNGVECRKPFVGNQVPIGRSTVATNVLKYIPLPNYTGPGTANYRFLSNEKLNQIVNSLRVDQSFGSRHHLFAFASARENYDSGVADLPGPANNGSQLQDFYAKLIRVGYDFTITPHLVNQITVGGNRINSFNIAPAAVGLTGAYYDTQLGIPNTQQAVPTFPTFNIGENLPQLGSSNYDDNIDTALLGDDNLSWSKGRHSVRVGGTYRWQQFSYENNGPSSGTFNFSRTQTAGTNGGTAEQQSGNGIASFLLGAPASTGRTLQLHYPRWISHYYAAYAQDDWKVRSNLVLNLGFRYSIDTPRHEAEGDISGFDPTLPNPLANGLLGAIRFGGVGAGRDGNKNEQFADTYYHAYEPRVGFAYTPGWLHDSFVLRGAYTIMYGPLIYADYGQGLSQGFTTNTPPQTNDPYVPSGALDAGPPPLSLTPTITPSLNVGGGIDYVAKTDGHPATVQNWTLETEQQLLSDLVLTLGYLGERGTHLRSLVYWENSLNPAYFGLGNTLYQPLQSAAGAASGVQAPFANFFQITNGQVGQALLPHPQYGYINNDSYLQNRGQSTYNAMIVKLDRKFRNGLNVLLSYTWSKTFTDIDPNLVLDAKGQAWLSFGSFWSGIKMIHLDRATGRQSKLDTKIYSLASRHAPPVAVRNPDLPPDTEAIEAPFIFRHGGYYYLTVSWDLCCRGTKSTYRTVVGRSKDVTGPYVDREGVPMMMSGGTPLLSANATWLGPGGASVLHTPDGKPSEDLLVFHAYSAKDGHPALQISTIGWKDGWPVAALEGDGHPLLEAGP